VSFDFLFLFPPLLQPPARASPSLTPLSLPSPLPPPPLPHTPVAWYLARGLAEALPPPHPGAPPAARLTFAHRDDDQRAAAAGSGAATRALAFYTSARANACVGCGEDGHWLRYRLVPAAYRKPLPASLKSHRAHDVVLLCVTCHEAAMRGADAVKRAVAAEVGIPLGAAAAAAAAAAAGGGVLGGQGGQGGGEADPASAAAAAGQAARRAAVTLHRHGAALPDERRADLEADLAAGLDAAGAVSEERHCVRNLRAVAAALAAAAPRRDAARMCAALGIPAPTVSVCCDRTSSSGCGEEEGDDDDDDEARDETGPATPPQQPGSPHHARRTPLPGTHRWHGEQVVAALLARGGEAALHDLVRVRACGAS